MSYRIQRRAALWYTTIDPITPGQMYNVYQTVQSATDAAYNWCANAPWVGIWFSQRDVPTVVVDIFRDGPPRGELVFSGNRQEMYYVLQAHLQMLATMEGAQ